MPNDDYFVSVGLQRTNKKIGKIVTLYQRELFKKIPHLGTFCTLSVNEGLKCSRWKYYILLLQNHVFVLVYFSLSYARISNLHFPSSVNHSILIHNDSFIAMGVHVLVVNPAVVKSSGRVQHVALYSPARPDLQFTIHHCHFSYGISWKLHCQVAAIIICLQQYSRV